MCVDPPPFGAPDLDVDVAAMVTALVSTGSNAVAARLSMQRRVLAVAGPRTGGRSGISVSRTYRGAGGYHATMLSCPRQHALLTIALSDCDVALGNGAGAIFDGCMRAGTACLAAGSDRLSIRCRQPCDLLHLAIPSELLRRSDGCPHPLHGFVLRDAVLGRIAWLLGEAPAAWLSCFADLLSALAVIRIRQIAAEPLRRSLTDWRLKRVQTFVEANIAGQLRLEDLARISGLSRMHFAAQFRAATGLSPHAYVLMRRVKHAKELIAGGDASLVLVALDCGFQSQAHFCTVFKRLTGVTPSEWRRQVRTGCSAAPAIVEPVSRTETAPVTTTRQLSFASETALPRPAAHLA